MTYFGNSLKLEFVFRINDNIKKSDVENLKNLFLFHGLLYYISEKRIKSGVTELIIFQEGQIEPHPHRFHA